jgi:hypothetical protein
MFLPFIPISTHFYPVLLNSFPNKLYYYFYYKKYHANITCHNKVMKWDF